MVKQTCHVDHGNLCDSLSPVVPDDSKNKDSDTITALSLTMTGKYVGNRPIKLRKSQWKDRNVEIVREPKAARGPYDPEALTRKERAKPYKVKKLNNAGK